MTAPQTPVIRSLLDTDLYKFTMLQVILHQFPQTHSLYEFRCRNKDMVYPLADIQSDLERELDALCQLRFTHDELDYLRSLRFIKSDFVDYLELFQLQRRFVKVSPDSEGRLNIRIEGPMIQAMFFEIFILAIVNELYFRRLETPAVIEEGERRLQAKAQRLKEISAAQNPDDPPFLISDFGTRRRYTLDWQEHVIRTLLEAAPDIVRGTSNVYLAKKIGITPIVPMGVMPIFLARSTLLVPRTMSGAASSRVRMTCSCLKPPPTSCAVPATFISPKKSASPPSARWRTSSSKPSKPLTCACAISKKPPSKAGYTNTAATSASR